MIRSLGALQPTPPSSFHLDVDGLPRSTRHDDSYFSRAGGVAESRHVFVDGSRLCERLTDAAHGPLAVGELGFGTGLNFLCTWAALREHGDPDRRLHYWSVDAYPLRRAELTDALAPWDCFGELRAALLEDYPPPLSGVHRRIFDGGRVILDCVWATADAALQDLDSHERPCIDAWYLDGFAPSRNADMWAPALFERIARCSRPGATVTSYSAAGAVRRGLAAAGFDVEKRPGFGHKRECIRGVLRAAPQTPPPRWTPWDIAAGAPTPMPERAIVIGAGLAGAHAAAALARRGIGVDVFERGAVAGAASGNAQGVLFTRLSHKRSTLSDFSLLAHAHAAALYRAMFERGELQRGRDGDLGGCFQLPAPRGDHATLCEALIALPELGEPLDAASAAALLGARPAEGGIWQASAGWLSPPAVCRALLDHPRIAVHEHCADILPRFGHDLWHVDGDHATASAAVLVVAAGLPSLGLCELGDWLPLRPVRGQTTQLPATAMPPLNASYCHRGYIAPAVVGEHCIGATFAPGDDDLGTRAEDHAHNIAALADALPDCAPQLQSLDPTALQGRAAVRAATPDYLPLCGPVPDPDAFAATYSALGADARQVIPTAAPMRRGLFLSTGFGSRGLSYAALGAELIASQACGEAPPLTRELQRAVAPARFPLRSLVRGSRRAGQS